MRLLRTNALVLLAAAALAMGTSVGGCGSGGNGISSLIILGDGARDCTVDRDGVVMVNDASGGPPSQLSPNAAAGTAIPGGWRALFSFDLASIPVGAVVTEAYFWIYPSSNTQTPFGPQPPDPSMGSLFIDHLDYGDPDAADYAGPAIAASFSSLSQSQLAALGQYHVIDVTTRVKNDLSSGRPRSQYRLRFAFESPNIAIGGIEFTDGEHAAATGGTGPFLSVFYSMP